jgi:hypothetical protein
MSTNNIDELRTKEDSTKFVVAEFEKMQNIIIEQADKIAAQKSMIGMQQTKIEKDKRRIAELKSLIYKVPLTFEDEHDSYNCTFCSGTDTHYEGCPQSKFKQLQAGDL